MQRDYEKDYVIKKRLDVYHDQTEQLIGYYSDWANSGTGGAPKYVKVAGVGDMETIKSDIFAALK